MSRTEHSIPVKYQGHEEFASFQSLWLDVISYIAPISAFVLLYHVANSCPFILFPKLSSVLLLPDLFLLFNSSVKLFSPAVFFFLSETFGVKKLGKLKASCINIHAEILGKWMQNVDSPVITVEYLSGSVEIDRQINLIYYNTDELCAW